MELLGSQLGRRGSESGDEVVGSAIGSATAAHQPASPTAQRGGDRAGGGGGAAAGVRRGSAHVALLALQRRSERAASLEGDLWGGSGSGATESSRLRGNSIESRMATHLAGASRLLSGLPPRAKPRGTASAASSRASSAVTTARAAAASAASAAATAAAAELDAPLGDGNSARVPRSGVWPVADLELEARSTVHALHAADRERLVLERGASSSSEVPRAEMKRLRERAQQGQQHDVAGEGGGVGGPAVPVDAGEQAASASCVKEDDVHVQQRQGGAGEVLAAPQRRASGSFNDGFEAAMAQDWPDVSDSGGGSRQAGGRGVPTPQLPPLHAPAGGGACALQTAAEYSACGGSEVVDTAGGGGTSAAAAASQPPSALVVLAPPPAPSPIAMRPRPSGAAVRTLPPPPPLFSKDGGGGGDGSRGGPYGGSGGAGYGSESNDPSSLDSDGLWLARTGTNFPMVRPPPPHVFPLGAGTEEVEHFNPPEPLLTRREGVLANVLIHDAERMANPQNVLNCVVYDSIEPPPPASTAAGNGGDERGEGAANGSSTPSGGAGGAGSPEDSGEDSGVGNPAAFVRPPAAAAGAAGEQREHVDLPPYYTPTGPEDTTLVFESRFESGNLRRAIQVYEHEYDLILRPDINTRGHTQWFYFAIRNARRGVRYKLNIINLVKPDSLYQQGMRPLMYSAREAAASGASWRRAGDSICYYQNAIKRKGASCYYTLTMTVECPHDDDTVYLAHCYPYTFTDLQRYLQTVCNDPRNANRCRRRVLCTTLAGNPVDLLTITSFGGDPEALRARRGVVLSGRVHPGESNASWMVKGLMDFLLSDRLEARLLRDAFVFKVVPMLNPDGVINGNYRCSLAGVDLNRVWLDPSRKLHPTIYHTKVMMRRLMEDRAVLLFADFHGHSRKQNVFMYGCEPKGAAAAASVPSPAGYGAPPMAARLQERIFPRLLWRHAPEIFSFSDCSFKVQRSKESTARVVCHREFNLFNSFTVEASFAGSTKGRLAGYHFSANHLESLGAAFGEALLSYISPDQAPLNAAMRELELIYPGKAAAGGPCVATNLAGIGDLPEKVPGGSGESDIEDSDMGSGDDSAGDGGANGSGGGGEGRRRKRRSAGHKKAKASARRSSAPLVALERAAAGAVAPGDSVKAKARARRGSVGAVERIKAVAGKARNGGGAGRQAGSASSQRGGGRRASTMASGSSSLGGSSHGGRKGGASGRRRRSSTKGGAEE